jgi:hypothetical protein
VTERTRRYYCAALRHRRILFLIGCLLCACQLTSWPTPLWAQYTGDECRRAADAIWTQQQATYDARSRELQGLIDLWDEKLKSFIINTQNLGNREVNRFGDGNALGRMPLLPSMANAGLQIDIDAAIRAKNDQLSRIKQRRQQAPSDLSLWCEDVRAQVSVSSLQWMLHDAKLEGIMYKEVENVS